MQHTYELMPNNPATHPVTGDKKIKQEIEVISAAWFSAAHVDRHLGHIERVYNDRPPEVVAPLAQRLLSAVLKLDTVRADAIEKVLGVIRDRGLWVEPAESSGGRTPGIEPAETFEEFVARNQLTAERLAERERKASRATAVELPEPVVGTGAPGPGRGNKTSDNYHSFSGRGTSSDYLLAKLARDCPEFFQRWKAGEFRSAREACLAAGIIKAQPQLVLTKDPFTSAQRIQEQRSHYWISDLINSLSPGGISAAQGPGEVRVFLEGLEPDFLRHVLSSLFSRRPQLLEQLHEDLAEDEQPQWVAHTAAPSTPIQTETPPLAPAPAPAPEPEPAPKPEPAASPAPTNGNGHAASAAAITELPQPGFYSAPSLGRILGKDAGSASSYCAKRKDGALVWEQELRSTPIKVIARKGRPKGETLEVVWR